MLNLLLVAAIAASQPAAVAASHPTTAPPPAALPTPDGTEIVVEGRRLSKDEISTAVRAIARPEATGGFEMQYARFGRDLCVAVAGPPLDGGQYVADHLGQIARNLGIKAGLPGCQPNAYIVFTPDPVKLIEQARFTRTSLVDGRDPAVLDQIIRSGDAVRSIASVTLSSGDGGPPVPSSYGLAGHSVTQLPQWSASRLRAATQTHLARVTVIVDATQITGLNYGQLTAYIAMVLFARLDTHSKMPDVDTILTLFPRGQRAPGGLTAFDQAFLRALYTVPPDMPGDQQRLLMIGEIQRIIDGMEKDRKLRAPVDDSDVTAGGESGNGAAPPPADGAHTSR